MRFAIATTLLLSASVKAQENPVTTTDVFVQSGEVSTSSAIIQGRCNEEKDSTVTLTYGPQGGSTSTINAGRAFAGGDWTVKVTLTDLEPNTTYGYSLTCRQVNEGSTTTSRTASFKTAPEADAEQDISFVWLADLAGQGWGRNPDLSITTVDGETITGGYVIFDVMRRMNPDFALFQGDMIYADGAIPPTKAIPAELGGGVYTNNPSKNFAAVTLDEFRFNWKYNFGDEKMENFLAQTPIYCQWDDHEVSNNWFLGEVLGGPLYPEGSLVDTMYVNSLQAFHEHNPVPTGPLYRSQKFGKHMEVFFPDFRTYRDSNSDNNNPNGIAMMGRKQLDWLINAVTKSTATWKIISNHDPIGIVTGGPGDYDSFGQSDNAILGRELELKEFFDAVIAENVHNLVFLTTDVHYTAAIKYEQSRATYDTFFVPLYEFVVGPIHAGAFGPNNLDSSFGPEYEYIRAPGSEGYAIQNLPPPYLQSFGHATVSASGELDVKLIDITGEVLYQKIMSPFQEPITSNPVFVQSGEISSDSAVINLRCNNEIEGQDVVVSYSCENVPGVENVLVGGASASADYAKTVELTGLEPNTVCTYSVTCGSDFAMGSFKTAPEDDAEQEVSFVWAADLAGQGWGRSPDLSIITADGETITGGYVIFEIMRRMNPDFALFQGDMIYADGAIPPTKEIPAELGGGYWYNNPALNFVAVSLAEFRKNWNYNHGDEKMQAFLAQTPVFVQWDDHEVSNNWFPGEILGPPQYPDGTQASDLAERSLQAFYEHNPIKEGARIFRTRKFGKHLEIFFLDLRSFRDPNTDNIDPAGDAMMGREQLEWLKNSLSASTATWKVISTHDPLSIVTGGPGDYDSYSQGDPAILGRELELKELFDHINENDIHDVVFLTSDVHFTAAIEYSKSRATGTINRFNNFWEFVIGPINAGAFGPNSLDSSFGPKFDYVLAPATEGFKGQNLPPPYLQSFGYASVSANGELSLSLMGINGDELYSKKFTRTELPITESDVFIQTGEVSTDSVIVNGRCNVPTNPDPLAFVTYTGLGLSQTISLGRTRRSNDFTVKTKISGLSPATTYTVQIQCDNRYFSQVATFMTAAAPDSPSAVSFVWAADLAGQGWGRSPDLSITTVDGETIKGGYVIFDVMRSLNPDFAVFQGDMIYADNRIPPTQPIPDELGGGYYYNNPTKNFAAITVDDFRANWKYNHGDEKMQSFLAQTPIFVQWDDHEVSNNWYPSEVLGVPLYPAGTEADDLAFASLTALYEFNPIEAGASLYRTQQFGQHLELFFIDLRTYRDPNEENYSTSVIKMMGPTQLRWLKDALSASTATWKIIATHDPIGIVTGGASDRDSWGQDKCQVLGREFELVEVLNHITNNSIQNVVYLTADVHFTAAINYDPSRAVFKNFTPFYEFVIGPINSGAFGPNPLDGSFGPEFEYVRSPGTEGYANQNLPPPYLQSFGHVSVSSKGALTVNLIDITGEVLYTKTFAP